MSQFQEEHIKLIISQVRQLVKPMLEWGVGGKLFLMILQGLRGGELWDYLCSSNHESASQNILKGIKSTLVFRETGLSFQENYFAWSRCAGPSILLNQLHKRREADDRGSGKSRVLFRVHRTQPTVAQKSLQQEAKALWFLWAPRLGPLCSLAKKREARPAVQAGPLMCSWNLWARAIGPYTDRVPSPVPSSSPPPSLQSSRSRGWHQDEPKVQV